MALEDIIHAHTEALIQNTEAVKQLTESLAGRTPSKAKLGDSEKGKAVVAALKDEAEAKAGKPMAEEPVVDPVVEEPTDAPIPYADVRALVLKLAGAHRDAIKAINTKHGIAKLPDLLTDANDFATVNDQAKLEAIYTDLQALGGE
jgi:hypothetical protein